MHMQLRAAAYRRAIADNEELQSRVHQLERDNQHLKSKYDELKRKYSHTKTAYREAQDRLDARTTELKEAEEFLSLTDEVPDTEVVRIVQTLNASIFQVAAAIADDPHLSYPPRGVNRRRDSLPIAINHQLLSIARSINPDELPTVIQVALQEGIVMALGGLASVWDFSNSHGESRIFSELYERMRSRGTPCICIENYIIVKCNMQNPPRWQEDGEYLLAHTSVQ